MNFINKKIYTVRSIVFLVTLFAVGSCSDSVLNDIDTNPELVEEATLTTLLPQVLVSYSHELVGGDGGTFAGYMSEGTAYGLGNNPYDAFALFNAEAWDKGYLLLTDLNLMKEQALAADAYVYAGIADVISAFTWTTLIDLYGDIPYSEALQADIRAPGFDEHEDIYDDIHAMLDEAIENLSRADGTTDPGVDDVIYNGDASLWSKTAYGLKARLYMKLINVDGGNAQLSLDAINNSFANESESFVVSIYNNTVQNGNPLSSPEFVQPRSAAGNGIFDAMLAFTPTNTIEEDPRAVIWLTIPDNGGGVRVPAPNGVVQEDFQNPNGDLYSKPRFLQFLQAPLPILTYTELQYIKAEAEFRLNNVNAYATYQEAVRSSLEQAALFNMADALSETAINTYLGYIEVSPGSANLALEDIILQKYIYLYPFQFIEAYNETRRTSFVPATNPRGRANQMTYPDSEIDRNPNTPTDQVNPTTVFQNSTKLHWAE